MSNDKTIDLASTQSFAVIRTQENPAAAAATLPAVNTQVVALSDFSNTVDVGAQLALLVGLMAQVLGELRAQNLILCSGMNLPDEPESYRQSDPAYLMQ